MLRTIESIVECHRAARDRQRSGRPIWDHKFEIPSMEGRELTPKIAIQAARSIVLGDAVYQEAKPEGVDEPIINA